MAALVTARAGRKLRAGLKVPRLTLLELPVPLGRERGMLCVGVGVGTLLWVICAFVQLVRRVVASGRYC